MLAGSLVALTGLAGTSSCAVDIRLGMRDSRPPAASSAEPFPAREESRSDEETRSQVVELTGTPLILDEEFDGDSLDAGVWNTCHWWNDGGCTIASNNELQWYLPRQVRVADGTLRLTAENRETTGADGEIFPYTSGMISTGPPVHDGQAKLAFTYGSVEVQFKAPLGAGLWPAIWMLPASEESKPEIDIFEAIGQRPWRANMYFHPRRDSMWRSSYHRVNLPPGVDIADTHTVRLEWSPGRLDFFFDGRREWEVLGAQVPDEPMYLVINLAVGGDYGGIPDPLAYPATFEINYVRIWSAAVL